MRKVIKISVKVVLGVVLVSVLLPVVLGGALLIPWVQNLAVDAAARWASKKLETKVEVGHIRIHPRGTVTLSGFYVEDFRGDTLLYAPKLDAALAPMGIGGGGIRFREIGLDSAKLYLFSPDEGEMNMVRIIRRISGKKEKKDKPFAIAAKKVDISRMTFRMQKQTIRERAGFNAEDIEFTDIDLDVEDFGVVGDSIFMQIKGVTAKEKGGLDVQSFRARHFSIASRSMRFNSVEFTSPGTAVSLPRLDFLYESWKSYAEFLTDVRMEAESDLSKVDFSTIALFAPAMQGNKLVVDRFTGSVQGPVAALSGQIAECVAGETSLKGSFTSRGLPDIARTRFHIDIAQLQTTAQDAKRIAGEFTRGKAAEWNLPDPGPLALTGMFDGTLADFSSELLAASPRGDLDAQVASRMENGSRILSGRATATDLDLRMLFDNPRMGRATLSASGEAALSQGRFAAKGKAEVARLRYNNYTYHSLIAAGTYAEGRFKGDVSSSDPNLDFDGYAELELGAATPDYLLDLRLHNADLAKLHLNKRDSISLLSCRLHGHASGHDLNDLNGEIFIDDLLYVNPVDSVRAGEIRFDAVNNEQIKSLVMDAPFARAEYHSTADYSYMSEFFRRTVASYLPALQNGGRKAQRAAPLPQNAPDSYTLLKVNVLEANNVAGIFMPGLEVARNSNLTLLFNPRSDKFSVSLQSDYLEQGPFLASGIQLDSRNEGDSISLYLRTDDLYAMGMHTPEFSLLGGLKYNRIDLGARFRNTPTSSPSLISVGAEFERDTVTGAPRARIRVAPSTVYTGERSWRILSREIVCDTSRVEVQSFRVISQGQELSVNGVASRSKADTLHIKLNHFDISPFGRFTERMGYTLNGYTGGYADIVSLFGGASLYAEVNLDEVAVNQVKAPPMLFRSTWDFANERARMTLTGRERGDTIIRGYYRPAERRLLAYATLKNIDLALLDPLLEDVTGRTTGRADADLTARGSFSNLDVDGTIQVRDLLTRVDFTGVDYTVPRATVNVASGVLKLPPTAFQDKNGNKGTLEMNLNLQRLKNITYSVTARPQNMLVLNTTQRDNDLFYGEVYGSGTMNIEGNKRGVSMKINATTGENSRFFMPLTGKSDISEADFITFRVPEVKVDPDDEVLRRKLAFERKARRVESGQGVAMDIAMALNVRPNTDFQLVIDPKVGDIIRGRGNGTINLHLNPRNGELSMYGDYQITEGNYLFTLQNIINKRFVIEPGSVIRWMGEATDPMLDIEAVYNVKTSLTPLAPQLSQSSRRSATVECVINLEDRLSHPAITFDVRVPGADPETQSIVANALNTQEMKATQFFWLLAANSFYMETSSSMSGMAATGASATGLEFLSNQLSNWMSSDKYSFDLRYRPKSELTPDEIDFYFSSELIRNRLIIEVEGNYDLGDDPSKVSSHAVNSIPGDFTATWLIDRQGNLRAKGFTRTIESFDENQGLRESGVGLYYKEDFNTFGDIITNFKERFKSKKRKAAEAAVRQAESEKPEKSEK